MAITNVSTTVLSETHARSVALSLFLVIREGLWLGECLDEVALPGETLYIGGGPCGPCLLSPITRRSTSRRLHRLLGSDKSSLSPAQPNSTLGPGPRSFSLLSHYGILALLMERRTWN